MNPKFKGISYFGTRKESDLIYNESEFCKANDFGTRKENSLINNKCKCEKCSKIEFEFYDNYR